MKKTYSFGLILLVVFGGYFWYSKNKNGTTAVEYVTTQAEKNTLTAFISGSGNVIVDQLATVDPTITGTVANVAVSVGESVKKGQLLFTIVNDDLTASVAQANISVRNAEAGLSQAKTNLINARDGGTETERDRNLLQTKIAIAEENLAVARMNYQNIVSDAGKRQVRSPIDGTVNAINIKNGDDLSRLSKNTSSQAPIIIGDLKTLKAEVQVNEVDIANVALGQEASMVLSAFDGVSFSGKVEKIDALGTITQGVVNYTVTLSLDTKEEQIRPGMSVSAKIITDVKQGVITVPNSALKVQKNKTYVEVLNQKTKLPEKRIIEIGIANNTDTEIISGINVGDEVITQTVDPNSKTTVPKTNSGFRIPGMGGRG